MDRTDNLPQPPKWVPSTKRDQWFEYWRAIYLDAEETDREIKNRERMLNGTGQGSEMETD